MKPNCNFIENINQQRAVLVLETGAFFPGLAVGALQSTTGTLCFNTAMSGYQEALSDPSYAGQILIFTFPHIGNVGVNFEDNESDKPVLQGVVLGDWITEPSNHRSQKNLNAWLKENQISGIASVDTRTLVKIVRDAQRPLKAIISSEVGSTGALNDQKIKAWLCQALEAPGLDDSRYVQAVSAPRPYEWQEALPACSPVLLSAMGRDHGLRVVVIDFGVKHSILRSLKSLGCQVFVVPGSADYETIMDLSPHALVLSNGPGDPRKVDAAIISTIKHFIEENFPILGICLGCQVLALIEGARIVKLPCGHHGNNHPIRDLRSGDIFITSHNHEFSVAEDGLPHRITVTHRSLFDGTVEGFSIYDKPILAVQFHPEACPGPTEAAVPIFQKFIKMATHNAKTY